MSQPASQVSYRQILAAALQRHNLTGTYTLNQWGPDHAVRWYCSFKMNGQVIGQSPECTSKAIAKEGAAYSALIWMAAQGFDVAYALGGVFPLVL
ncbi:hypothetical protein M408DRAFT_19665 [Serendipita vermifera MAFF 305830]|uniref:DRBM domain-containing protein n=1 Tax=Serendipita vermifera MAFF 305830 TaxID=933852 RepID=A0A0C2XWW0_SERVB|nr:hypothetical protein M408DRAFT_19660 [Serendipita vermifera MAFF 305830]KIM33362.1 hypothetical protein M408DRAFT_19665 [Serendipita vermifera MAFF 305830]